MNELIDFLKLATDDENDKIRSIRERCKVVFIILIVLAFASYGSGQKKIFFDGTLTFELWKSGYGNGSYVVRSFIKLHQMASGAMILAGLVFDLLMCTFYLYPAIRLQALSDKFKGQGNCDMRQIIKEHQLILRFVKFVLLLSIRFSTYIN